MRRFLRFIGSRKAATAFSVLSALAFLALPATGYILRFYSQDLPDYQQLENYEPPIVTRIHAGDGRLLAEYAIEKRMFVPISAIPQQVIEAFIAAEDKRFYTHGGLDYAGIARAAIMNIRNYASGRRPQGASTITQQVAKNFLLSNEVRWERKIKEALLAYRIERAFTKDRIIELYLNEIYLGMGSYGVAMAALKYFDKSLDELSIAEAAFLAALPKAPTNYHPVRFPEAAYGRRAWVIGRMLDEGFITAEEAVHAVIEPIELRARRDGLFFRADYFVEEVRREILSSFGETALYKGGLSVRTTLDPRLQEIAERALRDGLIAYDVRHGWRGPLVTLDLEAEDWREQLAAMDRPAGAGVWLLAVATRIGDKSIEIVLADGGTGRIPFKELKWARARMEEQLLGPKVKTPSDVLAAGDVVLVEPVGEASEEPRDYGLRQIPDVSGGIIAMNPHTGRVLAMVGGYSYEMSEFNRAMQAARQPGSAFKPIVYLAALDNGFTPVSIIDDAPIVIDQGPDKPKWKPANYTDRFYGSAPMRIGIEKSRNLMTVRLARDIGMSAIARYAEQLGVVDRLPRYLPMALGAGETTLFRLTTAYAMIVNGGYRISPALIERIQNRYGETLYRRDNRPCPGCTPSRPRYRPTPRPFALADSGRDAALIVPRIPDIRERVLDAGTAYQMVSLLQGVVLRGTGVRIAALGRPLAGKTGTTNQNFDTWFIGFSPDLVAGVFIGFDQPRTLGPKETGSRVAVPVFKAFMAEALDGVPSVPFRIPPGIRLVRIDGDTGLLPGGTTKRIVLEAFKPGTEPSTAEATITQPEATGLY
jgi:penicillin-binding protein 1A